MSYTSHFSTRVTPQSDPIPGENQVKNSAGGFVYQLDDWKRLERFLILGNEGGTYYTSEKKLTIDNAMCVIRCLDADPARAIKTIVDVSITGRAPKNDPAIFALAIAAGHANPHARRMAEVAIPRVCRIGTHLFQFVEAVQNFRGWGAGLRKAIGHWYTCQDAESLAYQVVKYQQRNGWSHRDVLRLCHVSSEDKSRGATLRWIATGASGGQQTREVKRGELVYVYNHRGDVSVPSIIQAHEKAKTATTDELVKLIVDHNLPRECIPTEKLNEVKVWDALLLKMPLTAMVRNLGKMSAVGLLKPMSAASKTVADRLGDQEYIQKSRLHPLALLTAAKVYGQGHGDKGSLKWDAVSQVNDAIDAAFYLAFKNVVPTGKRTLLALDVSGSMESGSIAGSPLTPREASAAMALVTARTEPQYQIMAFSSQFVPVDISKLSRLTDVLNLISRLGMMGTDCALPMTWSEKNKLDVDSFAIYTDNETWCGAIHPSQALRQYREKRGIPSKLAVVGMTATNFTIADPKDPGMMDFVGFDASAPAVMADFFRD